MGEKLHSPNPGFVLAFVLSGLIHAFLFIVLGSSQLALSLKAPTVFDLTVYILFIFVVWTGERTLCGLVGQGVSIFHRKLGLGVQASVSALISTVFVMNFLVEKRLGIQLFDPSILGEVQQEGLRNAYFEDGWLIAFVVFLGFLFVHSAVATFAFVYSKKNASPKSPRLSMAQIAKFLVLAILAGGTLRVINSEEAFGTIPWSSLPFGPLIGSVRQEILPVKQSRRNAEPNLKLKRRPDILVILVESLRPDMLAESTMPNVTRFVNEHRCLQSTHHFAGGHSTNYAVFSLLNSLFADGFHSFARDRVPSLPLEILKKNGYFLEARIVSPLNGDFPPVRIDDFNSYSKIIGQAPMGGDAVLLSGGQAHLALKDADHPKFVFYFMESSHYGYFFPKAFEVFKPFVRHISGEYASGFTDVQSRIATFNAYRNSVLYVDSLIGKILEPLGPRLSRGELVLAILGDHGEEFWEHGYQGHISLSFVRQRIESMMTLCFPENFLPEHIQQSHHVDILPTILDYASEGASSGLSSLIDGVSLRTVEANRTFIVGSLGFPETSDQLAFIRGNRKYVVKARLSTGHMETVQTTDLDDKPVQGVLSDTKEIDVRKILTRYYLP